ncbi:glutamate racemase [bacterium]|nr:glutamate racemase [bacterium]
MENNENMNSIDNRPIGFFDSGVGGLTVLDKFKKVLPEENFLYFGDTKHMPYGEKSEEELINFADKIFKFFETKNVKAVVMACNTTSAVTYEKLKNQYNFKIYPIIQSVAKILASENYSRIGILATPATINSHVYKKEIAKYNPNMEVVEMACPEWVKIVEEGREKDEESEKFISSRLAKMLWWGPEKIVLGCTHYPYLLQNLSKYTERNRFIDPSIHFAQYIKDDLTKCGKLSSGNKGTEEFFVSSSPENFVNAGKMFYNIKTSPELINLD